MVTEQLRSALQESLDNGTSLYSLAQECRVNYAVLHKWLNDESRHLRGDSIDKLAAYLGLELTPIDGSPPTAAKAKAKRKAAKKAAKKASKRKAGGGDSPGSRGTRG